MHECRKGAGECLEAWPLGKEYLSTETTRTKSSDLLYTGRLHICKDAQRHE